MNVLVLVCCVLHVCNCFDAPPEENYMVNFDSPIYPYGDESFEWIDMTSIEVDRYNDSVAFIQGNMTIIQNLDSNICMEVSLYREAPGGTFQVVSSVDLDICEELGKYKESQYYRFWKHLEIPPHCPIETGSYLIQQYCIDKNDFGELSSSHVGRYEARLLISRGENCIGGEKEYLYTVKIDIIVERGEK